MIERADGLRLRAASPADDIVDGARATIERTLGDPRPVEQVATPRGDGTYDLYASASGIPSPRADVLANPQTWPGVEAEARLRLARDLAPSGYDCPDVTILRTRWGQYAGERRLFAEWTVHLAPVAIARPNR